MLVLVDLAGCLVQVSHIPGTAGLELGVVGSDLVDRDGLTGLVLGVRGCLFLVAAKLSRFDLIGLAQGGL